MHILYKELKAVTEIIMGQSPPSSTYNGHSKGYAFLQGKTDFGEIHPKARVYCTKPRKISQKNDLLISVRAPVGDVNISDDIYCIGRGLAVIRCNDDILNHKLLFYYLMSEKQHISDLGTGSTFKAISKQILGEIKIPMLPIQTQEKIVQVLDKAQELIDLRKKQIELLDDLIESVFYDMFGDPVINPKVWEVVQLKDISTKILSGTTPKGGKQVYTREGIVFFRSQNVWKNKLLLDDVAYIDNETHNKMLKSSLKNKDILMTKTGRINTENSSLGRAAIFLGEDNSANINGHVYLIRLQNNVVHEFVLFILTTDVYREYIRSVCVGGIDKRQINKNHLEEFPIILPTIDLQILFAKKAKKIEKQKQLMQQSLTEMENNFNSLMQRAFKGELFN